MNKETLSSRHEFLFLYDIKMGNPNKPVRMSEEVKKELLRIKQEKELRSIDAVLKKLLKNQGVKF